MFEGDRFVPDRHRYRWRPVVGGPAKRHLLEPAALVSGRLKPDGSKLGRDIVSGHLIALRTGVPPFQAVRCKEFDIGSNSPGGVLFDGDWRLGGRRGRNGQE